MDQDKKPEIVHCTSCGIALRPEQVLPDLKTLEPYCRTCMTSRALHQQARHRQQEKPEPDHSKGSART
jgi:predicted sulfurtransferase